MNTLLYVIMVLAATILVYFVVGWITVWFYYIVANILVYITNDNLYSMKSYYTEQILWAWPIMLPFVLLVVIFYVPYITLLKFTPRSST